MKRYLIFGLLGPLIGGLLLLFATSYLSGYWANADLMEIQKFFVVLFKSLKYSYLFGILPALMVAALDEIFSNIRRISPLLRMLLIGLIGFLATALMYSNRGPDSGTFQFFLYGLVGLVPATLSSFLAHKFIDAPANAAVPSAR
ncbi:MULTISPECIES: DUF5413 family protein [Rhodopseudomonas]|uniref:Membrane protein n=1 Tax=Rhodopseudomonas palustris TaxID=1076 RepID=A0A0D7ESX9_RHOPL|nr:MULTISPECIES: DUF5413 family protein [Rhodopseudomonas]KIZ42547.1 membrane protein [Rhodopseudomonas palustris]MDF3810018.1 DUF5413 family protein [Rhodopseudomonas sp. BAL398]WOK17865.1 DUF5413 family protein [Rhodopseudomonas sp. BAL398]